MIFNFGKKKNVEMKQKICKSFLTILAEIEQILSEANLSHQKVIVKNLLDLLENNEHQQFIRLLNSVDMWGGSGAVWEIYIEDTNKAREFETKMINLIDLMDESKVLGKGIKPIRKLFKKNMSMH